MREAQRVALMFMLLLAVVLVAYGAFVSGNSGVATATASAGPPTSAGIEPRTFYASVTHKGDAYIFGGWNGASSLHNDVLRSHDGIVWDQVVASAPWRARTFFHAESFKGYIYLIGGFVYELPDNVLGDVWRSKDGITWEQVVVDAPWEDREHYGSAVMGSRLYLWGGVTYVNPDPGASLRTFSDVWSTADGVNWRLETDHAPWGKRRGFGYAVMNGKLWLFGGVDSANNPLNDVWSSTDGITWALETEHAPWDARFAFHATVFKGRYYILGGQADSAGFRPLNDVWSTADGTTWTLETEYAAWEGRVGENPVVIAGRMYLIGGYSGNGRDRIVYRDVWSSADGADWTLETDSNLTDMSCRLYQVHRARCVVP